MEISKTKNLVPRISAEGWLSMLTSNLNFPFGLYADARAFILIEDNEDHLNGKDRSPYSRDFLLPNKYEQK